MFDIIAKQRNRAGDRPVVPINEVDTIMIIITMHIFLGFRDAQSDCDDEALHEQQGQTLAAIHMY